MRRFKFPLLSVSLALVASGGAVWLGMQTGGGMMGCGSVGNCDLVLSSEWARFYGVPVAFGGAGLWAVMAFTAGAFAQGSRSAAGWLGVLSVTATILGAGWFTGLQVIVLKTICPLCLVLHSLAVTAAVHLIWKRRPVSEGGVSLTGGWLAGAAVLSVMAATWKNPASHAVESGIAAPAKRLLPLKGGMAVDFSGLPMVGRGEPAGAFLIDFTCTHCRQMLALLRAMAARDTAVPAVALLPAALGEEGAKIHRTLLSLFYADHAAWEAVVGALLDGSLPPRADVVAHAAMVALGPAKFGAALKEGQEKARAQMELAGAVYEANRTAPGGSAALPQLMNGEKLLTGLEADATRLAAFLGTVPLPPATASSPVLVTPGMPEMRPAGKVPQLPQWRPRPVPQEQQSPPPPARLINSKT